MEKNQMTQIIDPAQLPMREEVIVLDKIMKASQTFGREPQDIMEAAKLVQLRRIADALDRLAPPTELIKLSNSDAPDDPPA
jgi:hypothetical protein